MSKSTHRVLALFAAAALTAGSLVACAPKGVVRTSPQNTAPNATSQPSENAGTAQKPTTSQNAQPDTTSNNAAPNNTTSNNAAPSNTTSNNAAPTNSNNANATSTNTAPSSTTSTEDAPSRTGITGWLLGACRDNQNSSTPDVTSATLSNGKLILEGNMGYTETESSGLSRDQSTWISGPITLAINEGTKWQGRGGLAEPMDLDSDKVIEMINSHNGLGLLIEVENGVAKTIAMCS